MKQKSDQQPFACRGSFPARDACAEESSHQYYRLASLIETGGSNTQTQALCSGQCTAFWNEVSSEGEHEQDH